MIEKLKKAIKELDRLVLITKIELFINYKKFFHSRTFSFLQRNKKAIKIMESNKTSQETNKKICLSRLSIKVKSVCAVVIVALIGLTVWAIKECREGNEFWEGVENTRDGYASALPSSSPLPSTTISFQSQHSPIQSEPTPSV